MRGVTTPVTCNRGAIAGNVLPIAAMSGQMHFSMNNHYRYSETQAFGFSLQPSWKHIGLLGVRHLKVMSLSFTLNCWAYTQFLLEERRLIRKTDTIGIIGKNNA